MEDKKIIEALMQGGLLDRETADLILREAPKQSKTPEELIYMRQLIPEDSVAKIKASS